MQLAYALQRMGLDVAGDYVSILVVPPEEYTLGIVDADDEWSRRRKARVRSGVIKHPPTGNDVGWMTGKGK